MGINLCLYSKGKETVLYKTYKSDWISPYIFPKEIKNTGMDLKPM